MTKQNRMAQIALGTTTAPSTGGWRERLKGAFHRAVDNAGYVMNNHFALAASMGIPAIIAFANGVPLATVALGAAGVGVVAAAGVGVGVAAAGAAAAGVAAGVAAGAAGVAAAAAVAAVAGGVIGVAAGVIGGVIGVATGVAAADLAGFAAQDKAREKGKPDADVQKARWRARIGTAVGTFAAACMTAGAIHLYGTNMPERAPADAAPKSTCDIKESSGKNRIGHNMGKIAVGRAASGAYTLTLPPAAATPPLALAA